MASLMPHHAHRGGHSSCHKARFGPRKAPKNLFSFAHSPGSIRAPSSPPKSPLQKTIGSSRQEKFPATTTRSLSKLPAKERKPYAFCAAATFFANRLCKRRAALRWIMPAFATLPATEAAVWNLACAVAASPALSAASTALRAVLRRDLAARLRAVRVAVWRTRLRAEALLAMIKKCGRRY